MPEVEIFFVKTLKMNDDNPRLKRGNSNELVPFTLRHELGSLSVIILGTEMGASEIKNKKLL